MSVQASLFSSSLLSSCKLSSSFFSSLLRHRESSPFLQPSRIPSACLSPLHLNPSFLPHPYPHSYLPSSSSPPEPLSSSSSSSSSSSHPPSSSTSSASPHSLSPSTFSSSPSFLSLQNLSFLSRRLYRHWSRHRAFDKLRRLPNKALRPGACAGSLFSSSFPSIGDCPSVHGDFSLVRSSNGTYRLLPPYPPRVNRTIEAYPPSSNRFYALNRDYRLQWKNIEYRYTPQLQPRPWGRDGMWGGSLALALAMEQT
ncbi:hypothetical protein CSUI_004087 [Cystoisospora suis]|uniref:Uncharacterized protein n=1 Tax=Cystoisospora suis TaxID=483139 RepID=A0A2C6KNK7_9APIC|nr:hypothetical protein CSUI_004087 [Cystoisospora suis]